MNGPYIGNPGQLYGVEETRLVGGKGDGMRLLQVRNAAGLAFTVAVDRCADIYRMTFKGCNMSYLSSTGFVGPAYYQEKGKGFLKSFTAGFLTTCGLNNVGAPSVDGGEELPLHGTVGNIPAHEVWWEERDDTIQIHALIRDGIAFGRKLLLHRRILFPIHANRLEILDTVENQGGSESPVMLMYHINMGYPLLSEQAEITIPSSRISEGTDPVEDDRWKVVLPPQPMLPEVCYRHLYEESETGSAAIWNPEIRKGVKISFPTEDFPCLIQWNKFACRDYALGLEPRSFTVGGRAKAREAGDLFLLQPGEKRTFRVEITFHE